MNGKYHCFGMAGALGLVLIASLQPVLAQVPFPACYIQEVDWTEGVHRITVPQNIYAPGDPTRPTSITGTADAELVSGSQVRLTEGFHAGDLTGNGRFRAHIDVGLGDPNDVVIIAPDPTNHVVDDVLHVNKWEKLEIGLKLPQVYQDAVDRFFESYYPNLSMGDYRASPSNVDSTYDLNPYADDSLQLVLTLIGPTGVRKMKWGFFMREGGWESNNSDAKLTADSADILDPYNVRFRFAPDEIGTWQFALSLKAPHTRDLSDNVLLPVNYSGYSFVCDPPLPENHGYLSVNPVNRRTLRFDDSTAFFGLGTNMADKHDSIQTQGHSFWSFYKRDYDVMKNTLSQLHDVGGNFVRMYMMRHMFAPEWVNVGVYDYYNAPQPCNGPWGVSDSSSCQWQAWAFDQMLDHAHEKGIYIQLCIDPYPPILAYETYIWGAHPYVINYLEPQPAPSAYGRYDMKEFFYTNGSVDDGVFYYWKRKYKYIMSRWGYSVNIAAIEPFNEIDQMLTYRDVDLFTNPPPFDICNENRLFWSEDPLLPDTISSWITDLTEYVRGPVDFNDPANSPLGEEKKLFILSYAGGNYSDSAYFAPFLNSNLDLLDQHKANQWEWDIRASFDDSFNFRNSYLSGSDKKPFHQGEYTTYGDDTTANHKETYKLFNNYDVSFHNELWASTFYGNFAAGTSWAWERVFWWPNSLPRPPHPNNQYQLTPPSNVLDAVNNLDIGTGIAYPVKNSTVHHHLKPLSDLLNKPNWKVFDFFNSDFTAHKVYDDINRIESYYLRNSDSTIAIGWIHNLNAYWMNGYYVNNSIQRYTHCAAPDTQNLLLFDFAPGLDYYINYFPTRLNTSVAPDVGVDSTRSGTILLDLSTAPLSGAIGTPLDTLHSDYAFIIAPVLVKSMRHSSEDHLAPDEALWDFGLYPNPAHEELYIELSNDQPVDVVILEITGRVVRSWRNLRGSRHAISTNNLAKGTYWIQVIEGRNSRTKKLVIL